MIWPETRSGSGPVIQICPGGQNRMVVRECINTNWTEADYNTCSSFSDIQARVSLNHTGDCGCNTNMSIIIAPHIVYSD